MKKNVLSTLLVLILLLSALFGAASPAASQSVLTLKFAHVLAPTHPYQLGAEKFKAILEATAPSPVNVEIFHSAQLGSERELTEGMQLGTIDIAIVPGSIALFEPKMGVFDLPYIFTDREHARRVLDGEIGRATAANLPNNDLRLLAYWENGFRHVTNSQRPIVTPDDLRGLRIRVPENRFYEANFTAFGANTVTMAFGELYMALSQGTIDAQENPLAIIATNRFYEVQDFVSLTSHVYGPAHVLISEHTWNRLSPDMQQAIMNAALEAKVYQRRMLEEAEAEFISQIEASGTVINEVDQEAFRARASEVWEMFSAEFGDVIERILNY